MTTSGRRNRLAWFETLLGALQLLLGGPPPAADITRDHLDTSIVVGHKLSASLCSSYLAYAGCPVEMGGSSDMDVRKACASGQIRDQAVDAAVMAIRYARQQDWKVKLQFAGI